MMAASVASFAAAAPEQLDMVISLTEALLGLTRKAPEPVNVGVRFDALLSYSGRRRRSDGKQLTLDDAVCAERARCDVGAGQRGPVGDLREFARRRRGKYDRPLHGGRGCANARSVRIESSDGNAMTVQSEIVIAAGDAGITIRAEPSAVSISFPADGRWQRANEAKPMQRFSSPTTNRRSRPA